MRLLLVMLVGAVALAGVFGACGDSEEEIAPSPTTPDASPAGTPTPDAVATPTGSPAPTTPAPSGTLTFVHPTYGYSFEYPAGWYLYAPPVPSDALGSTVTVTSFELDVTGSPGGVPEEEGKVDFTTILNPQGAPLETFITPPEPLGGVVMKEEHLELDSWSAIRTTVYWGDKSNAPGAEMFALYVETLGRVYEVVGWHHAGSDMGPALSAVLSSFGVE